MMRLHPVSDAPPMSAGALPRSDMQTLRKLVPYFWPYRWRMAAALLFLVGAKLANVSVPLLLKHLVDELAIPVNDPRAVLVVPISLLLGYAGLRLATTVFTELREWIFAKATHGAARELALSTFNHLHALSLRFHLDRQTGGMSRDI